ncbi:GTP 3',8-cyclase MoaA [Geobacter sp.]|uniref:GTP 3',8-cyclase MoaA n=1 Tax=Geobacter sp. TaxID=46610 RepID=UPI0027BA3435|nr:GTP 3',8-cyclase MoaA [Geobacter sp.]
MELTDTFGRTINYLRLSVTDRCNMRCVYCMPAEGLPLRSHREILSYEELLSIARTAVSLGIEKIRVTGGEPLVRKGILGFLAQLAETPGLRQLVLTTNALHLAEMAESLKFAGVQRLNISLDSLKPDTFSAITRGADVGRVMAGIDAAERAGFPLKINMVVMNGINDDEILDFVAMTMDRAVTVRFIEYMPAIKATDWESRVVPGDTILERIAERFTFMSEARESLAGPARIFRVDGAAGTFGIISPVTGHFCEECNRIRVTAAGRARSCLFSDREVDLKPFLAIGDDRALAAALRQVVTFKPRRHLLAEAEQQFTPFAMAAVGG